jgi:RIO kinase 1
MAEEGQFADAEKDNGGIVLNGVPLDRVQLQTWLDTRGHGREESISEEEDQERGEEAGEEEDEDKIEQWGRVEDADWELARGDFTKMFNRSRQLAQVVGQDRSGSENASGSRSAVVPLPAMNRSRPKKAQQPTMNKASSSVQDSAKANGSTSRMAQLDKNHEQLSSMSNEFTSRLQVQSMYDPSATAGGAVSGHVPRKGNAGTGEKRVRDKSDHSTVQQVLDPRTILLLFKMLQKGLLKQVNGVISTGKEANVYHASTYKYPTTSEMISGGELTEDAEEGIPLALKIYKTTILVFKDRDRYITGEFRFRHGYSRHNPRKMVKLWAEKEARNLKRLVGCGIRCPRPIELRDHVLVMEYLQDDVEEGRNSPRLKDAEDLIDARRHSGEEDIWEQLYIELLVAMRTMFHECRLVHADLSEYNVLYHLSHLYIIDVSQSVEHDHPYAFDFLRADITHVDDYFSKRGRIRTLGLRKTFEWIIKPPRPTTAEERKEVDVIEPLEKRDALERQEGGKPTNDLDTLASGPFKVIEKQTRRPGESDDELTEALRLLLRSLDDVEEGTQEQEDMAAEDQAVFRQAYIPQTLNEVLDPERDIERRNQGKKEDLIYKNVIGVEEREQKNVDGEASESGSESGSGSDSESDGDETSDRKEKTPRGHRHEDRDAKKVREDAECLI